VREASHPLISRLRIGSVLSSKSGASYRVIEPVIEVAANGCVVPALLLEMTARGGSPHRVLFTVGRLSHLMRHGGRHRKGPGAPIDWAHVEKRVMARETAVLRRRAAASAGPR